MTIAPAISQDRDLQHYFKQGSAFTTEDGTCVPVKTMNCSKYSVLRSAVIGMDITIRVQRYMFTRM